MRRHAFIGIPAAMLLVIGALVLVHRSRLIPLSATELVLKPINPPAAWADPDCEKVRRAVRTVVAEPGLKTAINVGHLSADEVAVYRTVLRQWNSDARTLNVANRTFPLDVVSRDSTCECLRGLDVENLAHASHSFHDLTPDDISERNIRFVDANKQLTGVQTDDPRNGMAGGKSVEKAVDDAVGSGLFSISEIAFDRDHRVRWLAMSLCVVHFAEAAERGFSKKLMAYGKEPIAPAVAGYPRTWLAKYPDFTQNPLCRSKREMAW